MLEEGFEEIGSKIVMYISRELLVEDRPFLRPLGSSAEFALVWGVYICPSASVSLGLNGAHHVMLTNPFGHWLDPSCVPHWLNLHQIC